MPAPTNDFEITLVEYSFHKAKEEIKEEIKEVKYKPSHFIPIIGAYMRKKEAEKENPVTGITSIINKEFKLYKLIEEENNEIKPVEELPETLKKRQ